MTSTADCVKLIRAQNLTPYDRLIQGDKTSWRRVNKFNYCDGIRRYFYLLNSCLLATVDDVAGQLHVMVRPPMMWELYMFMELRPNDQYLEEDAFELYEEHDVFVMKEAARGSEPQQYCFQTGLDNGGWVFFSPIIYKCYDQHLSGDLDSILPAWIRNEETMECTYDLSSTGSRTLDDVKTELVDLGFEYSDDLM